MTDKPFFRYITYFSFCDIASEVNCGYIVGSWWAFVNGKHIFAVCLQLRISSTSSVLCSYWMFCCRYTVQSLLQVRKTSKMHIAENCHLVIISIIIFFLVELNRRNYQNDQKNLNLFFGCDCWLSSSGAVLLGLFKKIYIYNHVLQKCTNTSNKTFFWLSYLTLGTE